MGKNLLYERAVKIAKTQSQHQFQHGLKRFIINATGSTENTCNLQTYTYSMLCASF
jgi:hypothetical protein